MKKIFITISTALFFTFCLIFCVGATEALPTGAEETIENVEASTEAPTEAPTQDTETKAPATVEENSKEIADYVITVVTSSSFWATAASVLSGVVTIVILIVRNFNNTTRLIKGKADATTINNAIASGVTEIGNQFTVTSASLSQDIKRLTAELEAEKTNSKQLAVILSTFILHSKIGTSAKAEIMKMLNGYKEYSGTLTEIIEQVEESIALAEKEEEKVETPALNEAIALSLN